MIAHQLAEELRRSKQYFDRSTSTLQEEDAGYAPADGLMHTAGMMAHVAQTVDWFADAAFTDKGFVMDFEGMGAQAMAVTSLADARKWVDKAYARAIEAVAKCSDAEIMTPFGPNEIMGPIPKAGLVSAVADHTAHHRGVLATYARLCGRVPPMPYM